MGAEGFDGLIPADGCDDLFDEEVSDGGGIVVGLGGDVADDGHFGGAEADAGEDVGHGFGGGLHEGGVEGAGDFEGDGFEAFGFGELRGALAGGDRAGEDDLAGGVEVGGDEDVALGGLVAEGGGGGLVGTQEGEHGGGVGFGGGLHELAAGFDDVEAIFEGKDAGDVEGGVFAEGEAGGEIGGGHFFEFEKGFEDGDGGDEDGELGDVGFVERIFRAFEAEAGEGEAQGLVGGFEDAGGDAEAGGEIFAHADELGALAGAEEGGFGE